MKGLPPDLWNRQNGGKETFFFFARFRTPFFIQRGPFCLVAGAPPSSPSTLLTSPSIQTTNKRETGAYCEVGGTGGGTHSPVSHFQLALARPPPPSPRFTPRRPPHGDARHTCPPLRGACGANRPTPVAIVIRARSIRGQFFVALLR